MGRVIVSGAGRASLGVKASDLSVGTVVKLMENDVPTDFLVVHQGLPSNIYDDSCNGCWLLRKDIKEERPWNDKNALKYDQTTINSWLNNDYFNMLGRSEQRKIQQVKIPYVQNGNVEPSVVLSGSNGLSSKIFLMSAREIGYNRGTGDGIDDDGSKLDYFDATPNNSPKRISYLNGVASGWWTRSPVIGVNSQNNWFINRNGECSGTWVQSKDGGVRPALIIPSTARFDRNTLLLKG